MPEDQNLPPVPPVDADPQAPVPGSDTKDGTELSADVLRKNLTRANAEAANYRTQLQAAKEALGKAKSVEEFTAATTAMGDSIKKLEREVVAATYALPAELADRLRGDTREEMEADAKKLQGLIVAPVVKKITDPAKLEGGLNPNPEKVVKETPAQLAAKWGRRKF